MARIRSIKPDFWTDERVAAWPIGVRLTWIGLWTYVDDNGVGVYNDRLIMATLYPMDDPREALTRIRDSLAMLSRERRVVLYETDGKCLLWIVNWKRHQRVENPRKHRYPQPDDCNHTVLTCVSGDSREAFPSPSLERQDVLELFYAKEQGEGSREKGVPTSSGADRAEAATAQTITAEWIDAYRRNGVSPTKSLIGQAARVVKELLDGGTDPKQVLEAARSAGGKGFATIDREIGVMLAAQRNRDPQADWVGYDPKTGRAVDFRR